MVVIKNQALLVFDESRIIVGQRERTVV